MEIFEKIRNGLRKKVKEEEKKIEKKYYGKYTREELRSKAAESVLKKIILTGGIAVTCLAAGVSGLCIANDNESKQKENDTTYESESFQNDIKEEMSSLVNDAMNNLENSKEDISSKIDSISNREEALKFIKEMYLEEYNKLNGTEYNINDIEFFRNNQSYIYDLDGIFVTHGSTPNDVENRLKKEDKEYEIKNDVVVYSSYLLEDGKKKPIESFAFDKETVVNVILGDEYKNGKEISDENKNVLAQMNKTIASGLEVVLGYSNEKNKTEMVILKDNLEQAVYDYLNNQKERNVVENEIGGR